MMNKSFYNKMSNQKNQRNERNFSRMRFEEKMLYEDSDVEIIKDIFSFCCKFFKKITATSPLM